MIIFSLFPSHVIKFTKNTLNKTSILPTIEQFEILLDYVVADILFQKNDLNSNFEYSSLNNFLSVLQALIDKGFGLALKRINIKIQAQKLELEYLFDENDEQNQKFKTICYIEETVKMQFPGKF